jgi:PleD family two-component response regulator
VASLDEGNPNNIDEFLLQVDNQLYRAKREGRNRTCR